MRKALDSGWNCRRGSVPETAVSAGGPTLFRRPIHSLYALSLHLSLLYTSLYTHQSPPPDHFTHIQIERIYFIFMSCSGSHCTPLCLYATSIYGKGLFVFVLNECRWVIFLSQIHGREKRVRGIISIVFSFYCLVWKAVHVVGLPGIARDETEKRKNWRSVSARRWVRGWSFGRKNSYQFFYGKDFSEFIYGLESSSLALSYALEKHGFWRRDLGSCWSEGYKFPCQCEWSLWPGSICHRDQ